MIRNNCRCPSRHRKPPDTRLPQLYLCDYRARCLPVLSFVVREVSEARLGWVPPEPGSRIYLNKDFPVTKV